tara:strand:+ start:72 stop:242 length:171 start_codon:yes stop_codon:yes gene_type:complete
MIKVEVQELDSFLEKMGWHIFLMDKKEKGYNVVATEENYQNKVKPAGVQVMLIELI